MAKINNIHDTLFKETLSRKELAADFLGNYLPKEITEHIRMDTLSISKDSFVDRDQIERFSDLLYEVSFSNDRTGFVYFLFEHKSYDDRFAVLQVLRYLIEIWELYLKQHSDAVDLPLIIPIIVYHGSTVRSSVRLSELIELPDPGFEAYVPDFDTIFLDFSPDSEQEIKGVIFMKLVLLCFRAKNKPKALHHVMEIFMELAKLDESESSMRWLEVVFRYMVQTMDISEKDMQDIAHRTLSASKEDTVMTLAQRLESKGRMEGVQLGELSGRNAILNRQMRKRFGSYLDSRVQEKLRNATPEQLDLWAERILDAATIEDVIKD
ncbi:Rpn family recombination-promoting nuclease/putative transposase [Desulfoplanes sp.]